MSTTSTATATAEQRTLVQGFVNTSSVIAERELTIAQQGFESYCDTYKEASDALWAAVRALGASDADKAGTASVALLEAASNGKFKLEHTAKGKTVPGTMSKATFSRIRTMRHDSKTRRNQFKQNAIAAGKMPTFGMYVSFLGQLEAGKVDTKGVYSTDEARARAKRERVAAKRKSTKVTKMDVSTFVVGATKVDKLRDLYALRHDLDHEIEVAERGLSDKVKTAARTAVNTMITNAAK